MEVQKKTMSAEPDNNAVEQNKDYRVFDDVFRTMLEKIPQVMIPLINEVFDTRYSEEEPITQLKNEHYTVRDTLITDCVLGIGGKNYHLECQSDPDNTIALRMIEYDMAIALQEVKEIFLSSGTEHDYELNFPHSCVLYLRDNSQTKEEAKVRIRFQDNSCHMYTVPIVKVQKYTKDEIFEKRLLAFLPYYMMRYEKKISDCGKDETTKDLMMKEFEDIRNRLQSTIKEEKGIVYMELISHIHRVADHLLRNEPEVRSEMEAIVMGGQVYETLTDKILARGRESALFSSADRLIADGKYTEKAACEVLGVEYDAYLEYREGKMQEQAKDVSPEREPERRKMHSRRSL